MLLLHVCCADCALKFSESLKSAKNQNFGQVDWYYYNPNIHPEKEYLARMRALKKVGEDLKTKGVWQDSLIIPYYRPIEYFQAIKKLDVFPQKPKKPDRCHLCWRLRLEKSFVYAQKNGYHAVASTLVTSHYQNADFINQVGRELAKKHKLNYFVPKSINRDMNTKGFYKQNYCGCTYSLTERLEEKFVEI